MDEPTSSYFLYRKNNFKLNESDTAPTYSLYTILFTGENIPSNIEGLFVFNPFSLDNFTSNNLSAIREIIFSGDRMRDIEKTYHGKFCPFEKGVKL